MKITVNQLRQVIREEIRKVSIKEALKWSGQNSLTDKAADDIEKALQRVIPDGSTGILANTGGVNFAIPGNIYSVHTKRSPDYEGKFEVYLSKDRERPLRSTWQVVDTPDAAVKAALEIAKKYKTQLTDVKYKPRSR